MFIDEGADAGRPKDDADVAIPAVVFDALDEELHEPALLAGNEG